MAVGRHSLRAFTTQGIGPRLGLVGKGEAAARPLWRGQEGDRLPAAADRSLACSWPPGSADSAATTLTGIPHLASPNCRQ
jgi:hypothetical protein